MRQGRRGQMGRLLGLVVLVALHSVGLTRQAYLPTTRADAHVFTDCCPAYAFDTGYY